MLILQLLLIHISDRNKKQKRKAEDGRDNSDAGSVL